MAANKSNGVGPSRRTWDLEEYTAKARERDRQGRENAAYNQQRAEKGLPPQRKPRQELPKPTQALQQRQQPLGLDRNLGKSLMVDMESSGKGGPGFYCAACNKTCKDNVAYLDHINGRLHLMRLGQTTQVERSTLEEVQAKLDQLRAELNADGSRKSLASNYDFVQRIRAIAEQEQARKDERRRKRKQERQSKKQLDDQPSPDQEDMMAAMGFAGFGSTNK